MQVIKDLRIQKGMTQAELAQRLGVSPSTIGMYEQGRRLPDVNTIQKLSEIFEVPIQYLFGVKPQIQTTILGGVQYDPAQTTEAAREFQEALELAQQIQKLPPDQRGVIEQQLKIWHSLDKKD